MPLFTLSLQGVSDANLSLALTTSSKVDKDSGSEDSVEIGLPDDENAYKQCKKWLQCPFMIIVKINRSV